MRSGFTHYAERCVERFTVTPCSEKLVIRTTYHCASEKTLTPGNRSTQKKKKKKKKKKKQNQRLQYQQRCRTT